MLVIMDKETILKFCNNYILKSFEWDLTNQKIAKQIIEDYLKENNAPEKFIQMYNTLYYGGQMSFDLYIMILHSCLNYFTLKYNICYITNIKTSTIIKFY